MRHLCANRSGPRSTVLHPPLFHPHRAHPKGEHAAHVPTGGYLLSLSWSPEYCYNAKVHLHDGAADIAIQCSLNHFAFVLHAVRLGCGA